MITTIRRALEAVARGMSLAAGWVFAFCAFFITAEVLARNFLGVTTQSTTELSAYMLAFGIAWGLANALAERCHVRIDVFIMRLPSRWRHALHAVALALMLVLGVAMAYGALRLALESWDFRATDMTALRTPLVIPQGLWAFGIIVFALLTLVTLIESLVRLTRGEGEWVERALASRSYEEEAQEALNALGVDGRASAGTKP